MPDLSDTSKGVRLVEHVVSSRPSSFHCSLQRLFAQLALKAISKDPSVDVRQLYFGAIGANIGAGANFRPTSSAKETPA